MISKEYQAVLKELVIKEFIKSNSRAPSFAELQELIQAAHKKHYAVDQIGLSGSLIVKPGFREHSSASNENSNRAALLLDLLTLNKKIDNLIDLEEASYHATLGNFNRINVTLDELNSRLDNLLLVYSKDDEFLYGFEEDFSNQYFLNKLQTTACVQPNSVTLGKRRLSLLDKNTVKIKNFVTAEHGYITYTTNSASSSLLSDNGQVWQCIVKTSYQTGRVSIVLELTFDEPKEVSALKLFSLPCEVNKPTYVTCFYFTANDVYVAFEPVEQRVTQSMILPASASGVKKIQIVLSKEAADVAELSLNEYQYIFDLNKISVELSEYKTKSVLFCGPYTTTTVEGRTVSPTKASLVACTKQPTGTGISIYLSTDNETWSSVDHLSKTTNYVSFGSNSADVALDIVDSGVSMYGLVSEIGLTEQFDVNTEAYLNSFITAEYAELVSNRNIKIKRNIVYSSSISEVTGTVPGWRLDKRSGTYSCYISVSNPEGRLVDLGPKGAFLNGVKVTGETLIPVGTSRFQTDSSNWSVVANDLTSETSLKVADSLYPYNHHYIVSGYPYSADFSGEKIYRGLDEYYGYEMEYVSPEEFETVLLNTSKYYRVFTLEEVDGNVYFKVKVNKKSSTWLSEGFSVDFSTQNKEARSIYVKAVLTSNNVLLTPILESFKVRVS